MGATAQNVDFTKVKDGGAFNRSRIPAGDYEAKITKVEDAKAKDDTPQFLFTIQLTKRASSKFPYYCKLQENQLWKLRNLLIAGGLAVPKKRMKVDPNRLVGKTIGVTVEDDEYEGKEQSQIMAVFPASELAELSVDSDDDEDEAEEPEDDNLDDLDAEDVEVDDAEDEVEEEAEEEEPEAEEEDEEEGDEYDAMDRIALRKALIKVGVDKTSKSQSDDDLRNLLREKITASKPKAKAAAKPAAKPATKKKASEVTDDELEELDIDNL